MFGFKRFMHFCNIFFQERNTLIKLVVASESNWHLIKIRGIIPEGF